MAPLPVPRSTTCGVPLPRKVGGQQLQGPVDQRLGIGPRHQHGGRDHQPQAVELAFAQQVGQRHAGGTSVSWRRSRRCGRGDGHVVVVVRQQPGARPPQRPAPAATARPADPVPAHGASASACGHGASAAASLAPDSSAASCSAARAARSAPTTSSRSPSMTWSSLYSVRLMRWSVSRPLREVVGADAVAAVAAADQALARGRFLGGAFAAVLVAQPRRQHRHRLGLVAVLAAVVLAFGHQPGGQVGDADGAVGLVDVLAAGAAGAEGVDAQVGRVRAVTSSASSGSGITATVQALVWMRPWRFGGRHALHAVAAGLEPQRLVDARRPRCAAPVPCSRRARPGSRSCTSVRQPWRSQ